MKRVLGGLIGVALLVATSVPSAWAGGMEIPDNGTRSMGRAGAFTAKADDPSAIVLNPAGLAQVKGYNLLIDSSFVRQGLCFQRAGTYAGTPAPYSYAGQPYPEICRNLSGMFAVPMVSATFDFGLKDWTFAIGGYGPHAVGRREFPLHVTVNDSDGRSVRAPGPTRYDVDALNVIVMFFTAAAAYRPVRWLSFGAAVQVVYADVDYSVWVPLSATFDPDSDIQFRIRTKGLTATGILSALANPWKGLFLGFSVRLPVRAETYGDAWIKLPPSFASMGDIIQWETSRCGQQIEDGRGVGEGSGRNCKAELVTELPMALRTGIRYAWKMPGQANAPDLADVELDLIWERWSAIKSFDTKLNASLLGDEMTVFALPHHYQDVLEFRLGGSFTIPRKLGGGWLTFRAGWYYGNDASPLEYTRLDYAAWARMGLFAGVSYKIVGIDIHAGFSYIWNGTGEFGKPWSFSTKRDVPHSCLTAIDAFTPPDPSRCPDPSASPEATDISRGTYRGSYMNVSVGLSFRFDELAREIKKARAGK